jgi:hypothetical protein
MGNKFYINSFGCIPFNTDNVPQSSYVTGSGSKRPIGLTLSEMTELYWTVKSFNVNVSVIDMNLDPLTLFFATGGGAGGILGAIAGLGAVGLSLAGSILAGINGRTKLYSAYQRRNRQCKTVTTNSNEQFAYDKYGNIIDTKSCGSLVIEKEFVAVDADTDKARLCVAGPVHSIPSANGQGYVQINFTDIVYAKGLYWPVIIILLGDGEFILTSDILSLGVNQNNYNIGGINFGNYGVITMSGYSTKVLQPVFYSVSGSIKIGERCCDRFYFDGFDRNNKDDECYKKCNPSEAGTPATTTSSAPSFLDKVLKMIKDASGGSEGRFVGGGGQSGGAGASGGW